MIGALRGWRGLMVLSVVLMHSGIHAADQMSWAAVVFFFVSSGFLMSMRHPVGEGGVTARACVESGRRFATRVGPLHWLALAVVLAVQLRDGRFTFSPALAANALLVHSWVPVREVFLSFNKPSWFLATLLALYAAYPLLRRLMSRLGESGGALLVVAWGTVMAVVLWHCDQPTRDWLHTFPPVRAGDFLLGMLVYDLWARGQAKARPYMPHATYYALIEFGAVALLAAFVVTDRLSDNALVAWNSNLLYWLPVAAVVLAAAVCDGNEGPIGRLLLSTPLQWLGGISLELYMMHTPTGLMVDRLVAPVLGHFGVMNYDYEWLMTLVALFPVAWATHRWFTVPVTRRLLSSPAPS